MGEHQEWAQNYMNEKVAGGIMTETLTCRQMQCRPDRSRRLARRKRGFSYTIRSRGIAFPTKNPVKEYTKAQKEFLYDYYMERDCKKEANAIWKESDKR